jgi:hypothetical protein
MWWLKHLKLIWMVATSPVTPPKKSPDVMFSKNIQKHWGAPTLCLSSPFVPAGHEWREPRQKCGAWTTKRSWVMYGYVGLMDWRWVPYSSISFYRKLTSPDIFCPPNNLGVSRNRVHWKWPVNLSFSWLTWLDCDPLWPIVTGPWPAQIWLSQPVAISTIGTRVLNAAQPISWPLQDLNHFVS